MAAIIGALIEVILYVQDMDRQVAFYRDSLGLRVKTPLPDGNLSQIFWVEFETGACTLVLHGGGQRQLGRDAPKIVFKVDDITAARQELASRGVNISQVRQPAPGVKVCDGVDPEGNKFSIEVKAA